MRFTLSLGISFDVFDFPYIKKLSEFVQNRCFYPMVHSMGKRQETRFALFCTLDFRFSLQWKLLAGGWKCFCWVGFPMVAINFRDISFHMSSQFFDQLWEFEFCIGMLICADVWLGFSLCVRKKVVMHIK